MPLTEEEIVKLQADLATQKAEFDKLKAEHDKLKTPPKEEPKPTEDPSLTDKVKKEREDKDKTLTQNRRFENAVKFNITVPEFVKSNADILPSDFPDILKAAEKEKYDSEFDKGVAVKSAMIQSFFSLQANVDILTPSQKNALEDYLKLTKNGKEEKSESIFENIFEPTLEMIKRIKKVEELGKGRSGAVGGSKLENDYKLRLMAGSKKSYLGNHA